MRVVQCLDRFQFDDDGFLDQWVDGVLPEDNAVVCDGGCVLPRSGWTWNTQPVMRSDDRLRPVDKPVLAAAWSELLGRRDTHVASAVTS